MALPWHCTGTERSPGGWADLGCSSHGAQHSCPTPAWHSTVTPVPSTHKRLPGQSSAHKAAIHSYPCNSTRLPNQTRTKHSSLPSPPILLMHFELISQTFPQAHCPEGL